MASNQLVKSLFDAARSPDSWDVPGLLNDAADRIGEQDERITELTTFLRRFLNPEDLGYAVQADVRDDVREVLGMKRVEHACV